MADCVARLVAVGEASAASARAAAVVEEKAKPVLQETRRWQAAEAAYTQARAAGEEPWRLHGGPMFNAYTGLVSLRRRTAGMTVERAWDVIGRRIRYRLGRARDSMRRARRKADERLLRSLNIMDYSLLLGVRLLAPAYRAPPATGGAAGAEAEPAGAAGTAAAAAGGTEGMEPWRDGPLVWTSEDGSAVYYVTIIDLLQSWNLLKRLERLFKRSNA